jgi:hypothetical protein
MHDLLMRPWDVESAKEGGSCCLIRAAGAGTLGRVHFPRIVCRTCCLIRVAGAGTVGRVHFPRIECRTDALHVAKCLFATAVRFCNWILAAITGYAALRLLLGVSASAAACAR